MSGSEAARAVRGGRREVAGRVVVAALAGVLLWSAFPPLEWSWAAWLAPAVLGAAVADRSRSLAAVLGLLAGVVFWIPSLHWIRCVTAAGWIALAGYCSLYLVPPAVVSAWLASARCLERPLGTLALCGGLAASWAGWEVLRGELWTGFPWNFIGVSQFSRTALIQHAAWGGVPAVSFLVVWGNGLWLAIVLSLARRRRAPTARMEWMLAAMVLVGALLQGIALVGSAPAADRALRVALIQPAVPQNEKWTAESYERMYVRLAELTRAALAARPDLVVWPETALPETYRVSGAAQRLVAGLIANGTPLLLGALDSDTGPRGDQRHYNATFLVTPDGRPPRVYRKQHLVLFGEYVPFRRHFPWLGRLVPMDYDLHPGRLPVVFALSNPPVRFSTLICFEDTISRLALEFVRRGAQMLFVQTNDAWFDGTSGPRQHMIQSVFRAVETRVPVVRCANSGVTGWVDPLGRIGGTAGESAGTLPVTGPEGRPLEGFLVVTVPYSSSGGKTWLLRRGPVVGRFLAAVALLLSIGDLVGGMARARRLAVGR
ncbi:MAG: apolipoprotein N-acyltransferase [Kiritimatiellae bacterium]|nr:apolipoprotein N-acyltransferase [Kiritimatiellia bacterium]